MRRLGCAHGLVEDLLRVAWRHDATLPLKLRHSLLMRVLQVRGAAQTLCAKMSCVHLQVLVKVDVVLLFKLVLDLTCCRLILYRSHHTCATRDSAT